MTVLRKSWSLYKAFFRASLTADLEYRANFVTRILTDIFWYAAQIMSFEVIYRHTETIGSWNVHQTRVFLGIIFVVDAFYMIFVSENLDRFSEKVRKGDLDLLLTKPVNSQFMVSLQRANTAILGNLLMGLSWLTWALLSLPEFSWPRLLWLLVLIPCSLVLTYACRFFFSSMAVIFTRAENLQFLWYQIYRLGMRPDSIYVPWMRILLMSILPVAMVASVPARALLEDPSPLLFLWTITLALFFLWLSGRFWRLALRFYSSASS